MVGRPAQRQEEATKLTAPRTSFARRTPTTEGGSGTKREGEGASAVEGEEEGAADDDDEERRGSAYLQLQPSLYARSPV